MKYKILIEIECGAIISDAKDDPIYTAEIVGETAANGARDSLDKHRDAKITKTIIEYSGRRVLKQ